MHEEAVRTNPWIGKRLKQDIYNHHGFQLLPAFTILHPQHIRLLKIHGIELTENDVFPAEQNDCSPDSEYAQAVERMVAQMRDIFQEIRYSKKIPLADIRKEMIPVIHQGSEPSNLFGLLSSLQVKDDYIYRHHIGVAMIATLIGRWLHMQESELLQLSTAALLHDVGKIRIPQEILNNPDKLTEEEFEIMKKHTLFGYELIKGTVGTSHRQALVALQHHERMDGRGYPFGLKQDKIDFFSRIVMVADVFHAMTSNRVYRTPSPFYRILKEIGRNAFGVFDAKIVHVFLNKIMESLVGREVMLTDGRKGRIVMINSFDPTHPLVRVEEHFLDLSKNADAGIDRILI